MNNIECEGVARPSVKIKPEQCKGCGRCVESCPNAVLVLTKILNSHGYPTAGVTGEKCTGCGICFYSCPEPGAITVYKKIKSGQ